MTAAVPSVPSAPVPSAPVRNRVLTAARLNLVDARQRIGGPWLILLVIFAVNLAVFWAVRATTGGDDGVGTGAFAAFFIIVASGYLVAMTQVMPFALSLGITRRHFFAGTSLTMAVESLLHAVLLTVLQRVEQATDGWGLRVEFFTMGFLGQPNVVTQVMAYFVPLLTTGFAFIAIGATFRRWGQIGIWTLGVAGVLLVGGLITLITMWGAWSAVGRFFAETPTIALVAGYPLVPAAVAAAAGYLVVRRATP